MQVIGPEGRQRIARVHNAIGALRAAGIGISPDTISDAVTDALAAGLSPAAMQHPAQLETVTAGARARIRALYAAVSGGGGVA